MTDVPLILKLALIATFSWHGQRQAVRLHRVHNAGLDDALKVAPWLSIIAIGALANVMVGWFLGLRPAVIWSLPLLIQYWAGAIVWGIALALMVWLFAITLTLAIASKDLRGWPLLGLALIAIGGGEWHRAKTLALPKLGAPTSVENVVLQTSGQSCGAAAGANIARHFGITRSEREMAALFGTSAGAGTSPAQIIYGMRTLGLLGKQVEVSPAALATVHAPALLYLEGATSFQPGHVVMLAHVDDEHAQIHDSLVGGVSWSLDDLPMTWHGRAIEFSRSR